jgi:hypothetical protein
MDSTRVHCSNVHTSEHPPQISRGLASQHQTIKHHQVINETTTDAEPSGARARPHRLRSYKNCPKPSQSTDLSLHLLHALPIAKLVGSIASSRHQLPAPSMRALSVGEDSAAGALEGGPIAHDTLIWTAHRACGQLEFSRHAHCSHPREPSSPCGLLFASAQRPRTRSLASARWRRAASSAVADPGALPA